MTGIPFALHREVADYSTVTRQRAISVLGMLKPYDCLVLGKRRVGRMFDGGYVMADDFDGAVAAYSLGIGDDVSWDTDVANLGIDVHQYDDTIDALPAAHARFKWEKVAVSHAATVDRHVRTLGQLLAGNGHADATDLILKCDIEGHEWNVLAGAGAGVLKAFRQIVIELHALQELSDATNAELLRRAVVNLTANHHVIHVHANNWGHWAILGGLPVPSVLELTLLRKDRTSFQPSSTTFPTALDMPNNPDRPDFSLGRFLF